MNVYKFKIELQLEGAAFDDCPAEMARVLRSLADRVEHQGAIYAKRADHNGWLFDANGNCCGTFTAKNTRVRS